MSYVRQVITGLPEPTMHNEEQRERSLTAGKTKLSELTRITAILDP